MRDLKRPFIEGQLVTSEIKPTRERLLAEQEGVCPLCKTEIKMNDSALDHHHGTGAIRMVLCRWCNSCLGRIENWSQRVGKVDSMTFLKNVVAYLELPQTEMIHPNHGRPKPRRRRRALKTGTKRNARKSGKITKEPKTRGKVHGKTKRKGVI